MYHYTLGGLQDVYLVNGYAIKQTPPQRERKIVDGRRAGSKQQRRRITRQYRRQGLQAR